MTFIVGRNASTERRPQHRPRVGRMRPIWRVIAAITPMCRRMCYGIETLEIPEIPLQYDSCNELRCILLTRPTHSSSQLERQIERRPQCVGRTLAAHRPRVGRNASAAVRRPQCVDGASASMRPTMQYVPTFSIDALKFLQLI